jgi:alpha-ketoglutarate-dependent taurine dioxygenase
MSSVNMEATAEALLNRAVPRDTPADRWPVERASADAPTLEVAAGVLALLDRDGAVVLSLPERFGDHELTIAVWNLLTLFARPISQYESGELVYPVEVRQGEGAASHYSATSASGGLHTDGSLLPEPPDVALLLCLSAADSGGETVLVNAEAVHEHLVRTVPELVPVLAERHPFLAPDRPDGEPRWAPVLRFADGGGVRLRYLRRYLETGWTAAAGSVPPRVTAVMDALDSFTAAEENQTAFPLRRGQVLLWRNEEHIHGRRAFVERSSARRLVRVYARSEARVPVHDRA